MRWQGFLLGVLFVGDRLIKNILWFQTAEVNRAGVIQPFLNPNIAFSLRLPIFFDQLLLPFLVVVIATFCFKAIIDLRAGEASGVWWGLVCIGALSNVLDRITLGGVFDYVSIFFFPVFNVSDVYISVGVAMILWSEIRMVYRKRFHSQQGH